MLEIPNWGLCLDMDFDMVNGLWYIHDPNFGCRPWFWRCKEYPCPVNPNLGLWSTLEVPDWGLASWSWFGYGHWSLIHPCYKFWLSIFILKVQKTSMSFSSWFGALEDSGGSWWGLASWSWFLHPCSERSGEEAAKGLGKALIFYLSTISIVVKR